MAIITRPLIYSGLGIFSIFLLLSFPRNALAVECFSSPPSVEEGRDVFDPVEPRDLVDDESGNLEELFKSLSGRWTGRADIEVCSDAEDESAPENEEFSIESRIDFRQRREFSIISKLSSLEKSTKYQDAIYLCLDRKRLATVCNFSVSDIELITVTQDKLEYVQKSFKRPNRLTGEVGADKVREAITRIQKTGNTSFTIEKLIYLQGKLTTRETWQLEMK